MSSNANRPLSPHLQVYRPQMTSVLSILHRITGVALSVGTLMVLWLLVAAAMGEGAYNTARWFVSSPLGIFMMMGWTVALYYHLFNGVRHLIWDMGYLFNIRHATWAGYAVLAMTALVTVSTWYCAFSF